MTYTKDMKARVLGVPTQILDEKTAVCGEVAEAMALGALLRSGATVAVSITGVAGPDEDEDGNPVGLVFCGVARKDGGHKTHQAPVRAELTRCHKGRGVYPGVAATALVLFFLISQNQPLVQSASNRFGFLADLLAVERLRAALFAI